MPPRLDAAITLGDGRRLAFAEFGTATGRPVLFFHGTPMSRLWCPDEAATIAADVRLIVPDRPSVGGSDPKPRRTYGDWPSDVVELAHALELSTFGVVAVSAGGPYAAACAAVIPSRLTGVAIVSSCIVALYDWQGRPGIQETWDPQEREEFEVARRDPDAAAALSADHYRSWADGVVQHPEALHLMVDSAEGDRWYFEDPARVAALDAALVETFRQGVDALAWEFNTAYLPWGLRLADITIPVNIWHDSQDTRVSQDDIDYQAGAIPRTSLVVWPDAGHLGAAKHFDQVLANL